MEELNKTESIKHKIYEIRGVRVMLDSDLAMIYGYSVKRLNEQVKRNSEKFPADFMFTLTKEEFSLVRSQIATSPNNKLFSGQEGGRRYSPYVFTEQGVYMLATVLKGDLATQQSILIMRTFKEMRHFIKDWQNVFQTTEYNKLIHQVMTLTCDVDIIKEQNQIFRQFLLDFNEGSVLNQKVIFSNRIIEASIIIQEIIGYAKKSITVIDPYVSAGTFERLLDLDEKVSLNIFTKLSTLHLSKKEWENFIGIHPLSYLFELGNSIHDRYLFIDIETDESTGYLVGGSIKDLGYKLTTIVKIEDITEIYEKVKSNREIFLK